MFENREVSMKLARLIVAGSLLTCIPSLASAQETLTGTVTTIDRISGTIAIQQAQGGTVGAGNGGATEQRYAAPEGSLEKVHAGDRVTFSVTENGGKKTIAKIESR
jgi:Cu/Ag efflux protein CusF